MTGPSSEGPVDFLDMVVDVTDTLAAEFDLFDFLHTVTEHASSLSDGAATGLLLADTSGTLRFTAASDTAGVSLELFQVKTAEGPCYDCFRTGAHVVVHDLHGYADRWPSFVPRALEAGVVSAHAFPLRLRDDVLGTLNLFGSTVGPFAPEAVRHVQALADLTTISLLKLRVIARQGILAEQLQGALTSRVVIEQAKGILAHREGWTLAQAYQNLRNQARASNRTVAQVCAEVVAGT